MKTRIAFWCAAASLSLPTYANTIFSWETGVEGWTGTVATSTQTPTDGLNSLAVTTPMSNMWYAAATTVSLDATARQAVFNGKDTITLDVTYPNPGYTSWWVTPTVELIVEDSSYTWNGLGQKNLAVGTTPQSCSWTLTPSQAASFASGTSAKLILKFVYGNGGNTGAPAIFYVDKLASTGPLPPPPPTSDYFWKGQTSASWSDDNWTADATGATAAPLLPSDGTKAVAFSAANAINLDTVLGAAQSISSLSFNNGSGAVTIGGTHSLTLGVDGILCDSGSGPATINTTGGVILSADQTWVNNSSSTLTVSSVVSGSHKLTLSGTGTTLLQAANLHTGGSAVLQGRLEMGSASCFGPSTSSLAADGGTIDLNGFNLSVGDFSGLIGIIENSVAGTATVTTQSDADLLFGGKLNDGAAGQILAFVKNGSGSLTLNGRGSFTGNVSINQGTVIAKTALFEPPFTSNFGNLQGGGRTITVGSGAVLKFNANNILGGGTSNFALVPTIVLNGSSLQSTRYNPLGAVTLNGATLTQASTDTGNYLGYQFKGNFTIGGTAPSVVTSSNGRGNHLSSNTGFEVADVTGDTQVDLTISAPLANQSGDFANAAGGFTKSGPGTLSLQAANTFTGTAHVLEGTLRTTATFSDQCTVDIATTGAAVLQLDYTGIDTIGSFRLDGSDQGTGEFGALDSGAEHEIAQITGSGRIFVDPFAIWIHSYQSLSGVDAARTADPDHDGQSNLMEYALNGDPTSATPSGKVRSQVEAVGDQQGLVITLPVLNGANFTGSAPAIASMVTDRMVYRIEGSNDLQSFDQEVSEISSDTGDLPNLDQGWTYRTFRLNGPISGPGSRGPKGFLRAVVSDAP